MNPQNCPDCEVLHDSGDVEFETIYTAFGKLLQNRNIDLETYKVQWTELKQHIVKKYELSFKQPVEKSLKSRTENFPIFPIPIRSLGNDSFRPGN